MRDLAVLFIHLITTVARLAGPGGARSVVAESILVRVEPVVWLTFHEVPNRECVACGTTWEHLTFYEADLGKATFGAVLTWLIGITSGFHLSSNFLWLDIQRLRVVPALTMD